MCQIPAAVQATPSCNFTFTSERAAPVRPVRQLEGFERVALEAGAKKTLHFTLTKDELQFWSPVEKKWVVEPEHFDLWVGGDSTAQLHDEFQLTK